MLQVSGFQNWHDIKVAYIVAIITKKFHNGFAIFDKLFRVHLDIDVLHLFNPDFHLEDRELSLITINYLYTYRIA